ncbi:hypothetical protein E0H46_31505 [Rhizobium leguminosarum bv. viciae]|nr:hypothetical protein E0H46_31505 [Rhizobium leguminosarum bv. viciae]
MSDYNELVDDFIGAAQISLDSGFPRTAKRVLETHWLEATANDEQRRKLASLKTRTEEDLPIEDKFGRGALINLDHKFAQNRLDHGRISHDHLAAMRSFRQETEVL